ncbi:MAG: YncE family protein, partial [Candidatus Micrarchaeia archaeon]
MDAGFKPILIMLSLLASTLLTGCVTSPNGDGTGTDVTALAQSLPQVKAFLEQYPNAKITVALWDSTSVEKNIATIRADCGEQFAVADYYKVTLTDPSLSLIVWLDKSTQEPVCAVKGSIGLVPTSTPAVTSVLPSDFQLEYTSTPAAGLVGYSFIEQVNVSANGVASYYYSGHAVVPDAEPTVKSSKVQLSAAQQTELLAAINRADFFNMPPKATCEGKEICGIRTGGASNQVLYIVADGKKNTVTAEAELNDAFDKIVYLAVTAAQENPDPIVTASPVVPSDFKAHYEAGGYQLAGYDVTDIFANGTAFTYDYSGSSAPIVAEYYVSKQNMEKIYREIISDGFFSLKDSYRDSSIMDGGWYSLAITVSGKTKTVKASNTKVSQVIQIHDLMESSLENLETPPMPFGPTATPSTEDLTCVSAGKPLYSSQPGSKCCDGLVFNKLSGSASYGISGHCAYPAPTVAPGCKWVEIGCSQYGAYWSGKPIECNTANEGKVGMGPSGNLGGAYIPESYTSEKWDSCFTPRAMCSCGSVAVPTVSPTQVPSKTYLANPTVIATISVGTRPYAIAVMPNGKYVYVTNSNSNTVSVIDPITNAVVKSISVGVSPYGVAVSPSGAYAYVSNLQSKSVSVIDTSSNEVVSTINTVDQPYGIAFSPSGALVYVANNAGKVVTVIDTSSNAVASTIPLGNNVHDIAVMPNGKFAYVTNAASTVYVIDTSTKTVVKNITVDSGPTGIAITPNGAYAYVTTSGPKVTVI